MEAVVNPIVESLYEASTGTWQHVVVDPSSRCAVIIDPVLDHETVPSGTAPISTLAADKILRLIMEKGYIIERILETHAGDYRSSAWYLRTQLREQTGITPRIAMGKSVRGIRRLLERKYAVQAYDWQHSFDAAYHDGDALSVGNLKASVFCVAGSRSDRLGYMIGRNVFVGALTTDSPHARFGANDSIESAIVQQLRRFPPDSYLFGAEANAPVPSNLPGYQPQPYTSIADFCRNYGRSVEAYKDHDAATIGQAI